MNKNVFALLAAGCGLFMISCDTPSDLRPETKVSVDYVQPGTRSTNNVSDIGKDEHPVQGTVHEEVMPVGDQGANTIQPGDSIKETKETNTEAGATKQQ